MKTRTKLLNELADELEKQEYVFVGLIQQNDDISSVVIDWGANTPDAGADAVIAAWEWEETFETIEEKTARYETEIADLKNRMTAEENK